VVAQLKPATSLPPDMQHSTQSAIRLRGCSDFCPFARVCDDWTPFRMEEIGSGNASRWSKGKCSERNIVPKTNSHWATNDDT
jgi:hypothetical protein